LNSITGDLAQFAETEIHAVVLACAQDRRGRARR
jgi:hypothetical protein